MRFVWAAPCGHPGNHTGCPLRPAGAQQIGTNEPNRRAGETPRISVRNFPERLSTDRNQPNSNHYQFLTSLGARSSTNEAPFALEKRKAERRLAERESVMVQATIAAMPTSLGHSQARPAPRR